MVEYEWMASGNIRLEHVKHIMEIYLFLLLFYLAQHNSGNSIVKGRREANLQLNNLVRLATFARREGQSGSMTLE